MFNDDRRGEIELTLAGHAYRGRSVGSRATNHQFPSQSFCFDIGEASTSSTTISQVFITHGHDDHIGGLGTHRFRRDMWGLTPARYYAQEEDVGMVQDLVRAQAQLNRSQALMSGIDIIPVGRGFNEAIGNGAMRARSFESTHAIPCVGYAVYSQRKRLKAELQGASKETIIAAKAHGDVMEHYEVCEIAFPGDTNLNILNRPGGDVLRSARVLLLECTFLDNEVDPTRALRMGHVHLEHFIQAARDGAFRDNEIVLLTHFSARYTAHDIQEIITTRLRDEEVWPKVQLLLDPSGQVAQ